MKSRSLIRQTFFEGMGACLALIHVLGNVFPEHIKIPGLTVWWTLGFGVGLIILVRRMHVRMQIEELFNTLMLARHVRDREFENKCLKLWNNYQQCYSHLMPAWTTLKDKDK